MRKWELYSAVIGTIGGAAVSLLVAYLFVTSPSLWLAAILGAVAGGSGGAWGQNFIEGIVMAAISIVLLALLLSSRAPWPVNEIAVGLLCGEAVGWFAHGVFSLRS